MCVGGGWVGDLSPMPTLTSSLLGFQGHLNDSIQVAEEWKHEGL